MRKSIAIVAVVVMCAMAALLSTTTTSSAQAGSTGGTLGKTGKSASGGEEQQQGTPRVEPKHRPGSRKASVGTQGGGCGNVTGEWYWKWDSGNTVTTIKSDGTASQTNGNSGSWVCAHRTVVLHWLLSTDTTVLSSDGKKLTGFYTPGGNAIVGSRL
jgi:hypothetical protein